MAGFLFFTATSFISKSHFDKSTKRLNSLAEQELTITKHIFVVSDIQTRIQQVLEALIFDLKKYQQGRIDLVTLERRVNIKGPYINNEIEKAIGQYGEMKKAVIPKLDGSTVALLGVELYEDEFYFFRKKFDEGVGQLSDGEITSSKVAASLASLESSRLSLEKIMLSYFEEFDTVASNAQEAVISDQRKSWSLILFSNIAFFSILCLTFVFLYYNVLIPLKSGVEIAHRISKGEREIDIDYEENDEVGQLIYSLKDMASNINQREEILRIEKSDAEQESLEKSELLSNLNKEVQKDLDIINSAIHKVHESDISKRNKDLLEIAEHESQHLSNVINHVDGMTNLELEQEHLNYEEIPIQNYLLAFSKRHELEIRNAGMELYTSIHPSVPETIFTDVGKVDDIMEYTLQSILEMAQGGEVRLIVNTSQTINGNFLVISISEMRTTLDAMNKENKSTDLLEKHELESIDLSLHQKMVKQLGGELDARSVSGHGAEFNFLVPILEVSQNASVS
jgi:signal transduction histidine kinase